MAITATAIAGSLSAGNLRGWTVKATADADTTVAIAHGITFADANDPVRRCRSSIVPIHADAYTQQWIVESIDATHLNIKKTVTAGGSGTANESIAVYIEYLGCPYQ